MQELSLEYCYKLLELSNDDSFDSARKAYKQKMHRYHPDRYPNDLEAQEKATTQFMVIKKCFRRIEEYYVTYGEMPIVDIEPESKSERIERSSRRTERDNDKITNKVNQREAELARKTNSVKYGTGTIDDRYTAKKSFATAIMPKSGQGKTANPIVVCASLLVVSILAFVTLHAPVQTYFQSLDEKTAPLKNEVIPNEKELNQVAMNTTPVAEVQMSEEEKSAREILSKTQQRLNESGNGRSFTFGSSLDEVAAIHGVPDKTEKGIWYYDKSMVMFENARVTDWKSDPSYPLATSLK